MGKDSTVADEKSDLIDQDHLFSNLAGAQGRLEALGETGAASLLGHVNESLLGI